MRRHKSPGRIFSSFFASLPASARAGLGPARESPVVPPATLCATQEGFDFGEIPLALPVPWGGESSLPAEEGARFFKLAGGAEQINAIAGRELLVRRRIDEHLAFALQPDDNDP